MSDQRFAQLLTKLRSAQENYEKVKASFLERLETNPVYAFQWSESVMYAAAEAKLHNEHADAIELNQTFDEPMSFEAVIEFLTKELTTRVISGAENTSNSSSSTHNLIAQYETAAAAKLLKNITVWWSF